MKENYYFVYRTTNTVTGEFYIGVHHSVSLEDSYLGSGRELRKAIQEYGRENFKREVLELCGSSEEAYEAEARYVTWKEVLDPKCYNVKLGGKGGADSLTYMHLGESCIRVRENEIESYLRRGYKLGRPESCRERRKRMKYVQKDGITKCILPEDLPKYLEAGWQLGRAYLKDRVQVWQDNHRIYVHPSEVENYIKQGWVKEMPEFWKTRIRQARQKIGSTTKSRVRVTDGVKDKLVESNQVDQFLQEGWKLGGKSKNAGFRWMSK